MRDITYTTADALNDALVNAGVDCVFINFGTDYPPIIESWAKAEAHGRKIPRVIISPHEYPAISAAQGYAQITGKAQAVFVHVDVGTQNLGGAVHNAFRCRVPVFIFAGLSPYTMEGELHGGRNAAIQFIQNAADQAGIVRGYTKLNYEYRSGQNIQQMTYRALQIAESEPGGPVYMTATREVLEEAGVDINADLSLWSKVSPLALDDKSVKILTDALTRAKKPMIITSYLGRNTESVGELVKLAEKLAIPVVEVNEQAYMNFPGDNPLHLGFDSHDLIADADLALVIDCDLPWIPSRAAPKEDCRVFYLDADPLKEDIPLWYIKAERFMRADSYTALRQINTALDSAVADAAVIETRRATVHNIHKQQRGSWIAEVSEAENHITPEFLTMCVREIIDDDTVILNETITNRAPTDRLLPRNKPGTLFSNGASSLGWHGGAAVGMKLACPDKDVVALCGDGTYIFSCPTAVHWMAAKYNTPFMTVIYNNQGWNAPKQITTRQHPDGYAVRDNNFWTSLNPPARLDLVAEAAGGAFARTVENPKELRKILAEGWEAVRQGRAAVINVMLPSV
ncbi:MAG: thiamine pyrophosphate-requiring protein [Oscillospiraceae bacterium]|nr:thiamine pyrophosphate-requiring protein [Oscillospiraceae bacterium]